MIARSREWLLPSVSFRVNEVWRFWPSFTFLCLWSRGCFFLVKALRLDLLLFALLEAEHSISEEKACHLGSFLPFCSGDRERTSGVNRHPNAR